MPSDPYEIRELTTNFAHFDYVGDAGTLESIAPIGDPPHLTPELFPRLDITAGGFYVTLGRNTSESSDWEPFVSIPAHSLDAIRTNAFRMTAEMQDALKDCRSELLEALDQWHGLGGRTFDEWSSGFRQAVNYLCTIDVERPRLQNVVRTGSAKVPEHQRDHSGRPVPPPPSLGISRGE